jgi:LacI family repressor for deo operon, udp, cdd, tsx, nupC, and nupG
VPVGPGVPVVLVAERAAGAAVARHLLGLGHRRFGYIAGLAGHHVEEERWAGFSGALAAAGIAAAGIARFAGDFYAASGVAAGRAFLALAARPTAVFAASDMMAIGFMHALRAAGLSVPRDVSLVGYDGIEAADYSVPPLTTVRQPREAMGRAAAELLLRLIGGETIPPEARVLTLDGVLRPGASTAPPPRRAMPKGAFADEPDPLAPLAPSPAA